MSRRRPPAFSPPIVSHSDAIAGEIGGGQVEQLGDLSVGPLHAVAQDDGNALVLSELLQRRAEGRFNPRLGDRVLPLAPDQASPPDRPAGVGLPHPVEVAGRVPHLGDAAPVPPCPRECVEHRVPAELGAVRRDEGASQARLDRDHELVELAAPTPATDHVRPSTGQETGGPILHHPICRRLTADGGTVRTMAAHGDGTEDEALALARDLVAALDQIRSALPPPRGGIGARLRDHLGGDPRALPGVVERVPLSDHVNLQLALDELRRDAPIWELVGLPADVGNYSGFSITGLVSGRFGLGIDEQPVETMQLPSGVDEHVECVRAGLVLTEHEGVRVGMLVFVQQHGMAPELVLEVIAAEDGVAGRLVSRIKELMRERNVFRGKAISFSFGVHGEFGLQFVRVPAVTREDVIMPPADLAAIEDHTMAVATHADALRAAGQHLRRGLLLYGPPGTGKTHTVMYLCNELEGRTVVILAGPALHAIGQAGTLARELSPAMIVIEDVDLIGMDRGLPGGEHNPLLFQLLNEMDGIGDDADVIFLLTTNRIDLLEPALAARPGRIDRAIEIDLPDDDARARLLRLYLPPEVEFVDSTLADVVDRTRGAAAAFIKELARRTVLTQLTRGQGPDEAIRVALDEMIEHAPPILRRSLGVAHD